MQSHHAYLCEGPLALLPALASSACAHFDFEQNPSALLGASNPDVSVRQWEKFGIEESRELAERAHLRSASGRQLFVIGVSSITSEAQQALLKLFEEPQEGAVFVLLAPHGTLLPTLRSRCIQYPETITQEADVSQAKIFLSSTYKQRSDWIAEFLDDEEGVRERVRQFLTALESVLHTALQSGKERAAVVDGLSDIARFRDYLSDRAPSLKMILEHFAATLPQLR